MRRRGRRRCVLAASLDDGGGARHGAGGHPRPHAPARRALRQVLEVASVIGRDVPFPCCAPSPAAPRTRSAADLRRLQDAEFLYETRVFPEVEYTFKHALTQDVAYGRVDARDAARPARAHRRRASRSSPRPARRARRAAGLPRLPRRAVAARAALRAPAGDQGLRPLGQPRGGGLVRPGAGRAGSPARDARDAGRGDRHPAGGAQRAAPAGRAASGSSRDLGEAEALATALGDRRRLGLGVDVHDDRPPLRRRPGRRDGRRRARAALAEEVGDVGLRASARTPLAHACRERGDFRRRADLFGEAIDLLAGDLVRERLGQAMPPSFYAREHGRVLPGRAGRVRRGRAAGDRGRDADAPARPAVRLRAGPAWRSATSRLVQGRPEEAMRCAGPGAGGHRGARHPDVVPWAAALRGYALALAGRVDEGAALLARRAGARRRAALPVRPLAVGGLAGPRRTSWPGDWTRRGAAREEALRLSRERGTARLRGVDALRAGRRSSRAGAARPTPRTLHRARRWRWPTTLGMRRSSRAARR